MSYFRGIGDSSAYSSASQIYVGQVVPFVGKAPEGSITDAQAEVSDKNEGDERSLWLRNPVERTASPPLCGMEVIAPPLESPVVNQIHRLASILHPKAGDFEPKGYYTIDSHTLVTEEEECLRTFTFRLADKLSVENAIEDVINKPLPVEGRLEKLVDNIMCDTSGIIVLSKKELFTAYCFTEEMGALKFFDRDGNLTEVAANSKFMIVAYPSQLEISQEKKELLRKGLSSACLSNGADFVWIDEHPKMIIEPGPVYESYSF